MYQALYRKYRPVDFNDVISQEHITTTLKNQIISGKTAHAYLFTGSRGTGKTTCARILAKAMNCEDPKDGNPCNKCPSCIDADKFALSDIIEIDAASNNSVNDARELREATAYATERCRYKVYIIDEVHMLSKDAFNAMLKVIEEPPPHIKFIMATTELHKVLPTILSRCQRFDFVRIRTEDIAARILHIAELEGINVDSDAAQLIAKNADGGMRDALSILDRCIAFSGNITADVVSEAAGLTGRDSLFALAEAVADKNAAAALGIISELYDKSKDMPTLCEELITQLRNVMILLSAPDRKDIIVCLPSEMEILERIAAKTDINTVMAWIDALSKCSERMTRSLSKRVDMEMCVIRMCGNMQTAAQSAPAAPSTEIIRLTEKIAALERALENGAGQQRGNARPPVPRPRPAAEIPQEPASSFEYISGWLDIIDRIRVTCPALAPNMSGSDGYAVGNRVVINTKRPMIKKLMGEDENKERVLNAVSDVTGKRFSTVLVGYRPNLDRSLQGGGAAEPQAAPTPEQNLDALLKRASEAGVEISDEQ